MIKTPSQKKAKYFVFVIAILSFLTPTNVLHAQGPNAPEAASFEPVDATDMVNLVTGDLSYVLPLLNIPSPEGGYPIALSYHAGIAMEQEASWVGLGWSLNPGAINRSVNGYPDDWEKTRVSELYYDEGGSTNYYSFSIGGTLPNGITLGVSKSWGGYRAWGGVVGYGGQKFYFGSEGIGFGISSGPLSYNASSNGGSSVGLNYTYSPSGTNADTGKPINPNGLGASFGYDFGSKSFSVTGFSKKAGIGISFNSFNGGSLSINGNGATSQSTSANKDDYYIKTTNKGFSIDVGFFWASYRHTKVSYSLFKDNVVMPSGILNTFDYRINSTLPRDNESYGMMDIKEYYADDNDYEDYTHNTLNFSTIPAISLPNYDNYSVSAQGIGGNISPQIYDEITLVGKNHYTKGLYDDYKETVTYLQGDFLNQSDFKLGNKIHFYFNNTNSSFLRTNKGSITGNNLNGNGEIINGSELDIYNDTEAKAYYTSLNNTYSNTTTISGDIKKVGNRKRDGNFIETFTNKNIIEGNTKGWFIKPKSEAFYRGGSPIRYTNLLNDEGIGAYRITTIDGKVYHYSLPVYHYESIYKTFPENTDENNKFFQSKKVTPYATHWLLTAITGPDYVDKNSNGELDEEDYGYWIEFEYGRWSEGYGWKSPKEGFKTQSGNKSYFMGVKEVYYLDQIKTRTHTALFVKSLRKDNKSYPINIYNEKWSGNFNDPIYSETYSKYIKDKEYKNYTLNGDFYLRTIYTQQPYINVHYTGHSINTSKKFVTTYMDIPENYSLKLDKILILKNEDVIYNKTIDNAISNNRKFGNSYHNSGYTGSPEQPYTTPVTLSNNIPISPNWHFINSDKYVLDKDDIVGLGLESKAIKIISFKYDYSLSNNLPNSSSGHLTLKEIHTKGKSGIQLMPPFKFEYTKSNTPYNKDNQDVWGYVINNPDAWSLNKIKTPLGSEIEIEYEADSFYAEAGYRSSGLQQDFWFSDLNTVSVQNYVNIVDFQKGNDYIEVFFNPSKVFNLNQLAIPGTPVQVSIGRRDSGHLAWTGTHSTSTIYTTSLINNYTIESVNLNQSSIRFTINELTNLETHQLLVNLECPLNDGNYIPSTENDFCICSIQFSLYSGFFTYTDPNGKLGGGIRVKNINIKEGANTYKTGYNYNNPVSNTISGITSYEPFDGENKIVPYIGELPAPNVLYSNVCVSTLVNNTPQNLTKYTFKTLTPFKISDDKEVLYSLGDDFKVIREQFLYKTLGSDSWTDYPLNEKLYKIYKHTIHNNLSNIGSLLTVKNYNSKAQLMESTINYYHDFNSSIENHNNGISQESFLVCKKWDFNFLHSNNVIKGQTGYNIGSTSKINYPSVIESTTTIQDGFTSTKNFLRYDFLTGQVLETTTKDSKGNEFKTELVPAYSIFEYSGNVDLNNNNKPDGYGMGSKVDVLINKNMLTQEAMTKTYKKLNGQWKETGVGITTWNNQWDYTNYDGNKTLNSAIPDSQKIWRKHKNYVWNGDLDTDGTYLNYDTNSSFDWTVGQNTVQTNAKWKNVSTTTLYDHYSMPLETRDINGNYVSTKMDKDHEKILSVSNAGYTEQFYSGAEMGDTGWSGGHIEINDFYDGEAHTGLYSEIASVGGKSFKCFPKPILKSGQGSKRFKISVWTNKESYNAATKQSTARIHINGSDKPFNGEVVQAGDWVQLNHYENLSAETEVYVTASETVYLDDFRLYPAASSLTGYVYNEWDELSYMIGNNGLATKFEYDAAGRLIKTYTEVADFNGPGTGGFKIMSENNYHYKHSY